jgi:hypothetical protein
MSDETANQLRAWAASGLTKNLFSGATPLCDTLAQAADHIDALQSQLAEANRALAEWAKVSQRNFQRAKEAEERLAEARGAGWQPIETLPPRFTTVDIWLSGGFRVANATHPSQYPTATHWWDFGLGQTSPEPPPDTALAKIDPKP